MSLELKVAKGVSWMAFFNSFSQVFSWIITIVIARILVPGDYGLMSMSTIITGYALTVSELGLGNAIIQRAHVSKNELSSVFWFLLALSVVLALCCFPLAYLTASIMREIRVIPLTQTVGIVFILSGLQIVPSSLLRKEMNFKSVGFIDFVATIISSGSMLVIAEFKGGVWTLLFGNIIRSLVRTIMLFQKTNWRPSFHFNFNESKEYLSFGIILAIGRSLFYVQEKSDRFFAGRAWKSQTLGYYSFALDLAQIPTDKIVSLINNVSFPAFSKLQNDNFQFNKLYLNITKVTSTIVLPLFIGGFLLGEDVIKLLLNPKWFPMILLFRLLCLSQILTSLNAINNFVHAAQGRPNWSLYFNIVSVVCMPVSFYFAVQKGLNFIAIPWLSTYLALTIVWIFLSIRKLGIPVLKYIRNILSPLSATAVMAVVLVFVHLQCLRVKGAAAPYITVGFCLLFGISSYCAYFWFFERSLFLNLLNLFKRRQLRQATEIF